MIMNRVAEMSMALPHIQAMVMEYGNVAQTGTEALANADALWRRMLQRQVIRHRALCEKGIRGLMRTSAIW